MNHFPITEKKRNFTLLVIFILSLAIKIAISCFATYPIIFNKYPYFAERLSRGVDIGERLLDLSPSYLYATVVFFKAFGPNWELLTLLQILLGSLNCLLIYSIGSKIFGAVIGLLAATMLMLYGNMTLIELTIEPEAFLLFFNSLAIFTLIQAGSENIPSYRSWRWFLAGVVIGLSAITKANAILIIPGAVIWIWFSVKTRRNKYRAIASLLMGIFLLIAPITIRNYVQFKDFILITADGGKVFFHGNGPGATGMERADLPNQGFIEERQAEPDYAHTLFRETARAITKAPLKPSECSDYWFARTFEHMRSDPRAALYLEWKKFCLFWNNYEVHDLDSTYKNYLTLQGWPFLTIGILTALGLLGMGTSLGRFRQAFLVYWMVFIYMLSVLVFFAASRYRLPAAPFLCIFASSFLGDLFLFTRQKEITKCACGLLLIPFLLAWAYLPFRHEIEQFDRWQQASRIHYSLGGRMLFNKREYQEAIREFEMVISVDPYFAPAYNYMGKSYAILGNLDKAQNYFKKVIALSPSIDEGYLNMGLLLQLKGESLKALPYFEKALSLNPNNAKTKTHRQKLKDLFP